MPDDPWLISYTEAFIFKLEKAQGTPVLLVCCVHEETETPADVVFSVTTWGQNCSPNSSLQTPRMDGSHYMIPNCYTQSYHLF